MHVCSCPRAIAGYMPSGLGGYAAGGGRRPDCQGDEYTAADICMAGIARLAARRSHNPKVVSSILTRRILKCKVATSNHPIIESLNVLITWESGTLHYDVRFWYRHQKFLLPNHAYIDHHITIRTIDCGQIHPARIELATFSVLG